MCFTSPKITPLLGKALRSISLFNLNWRSSSTEATTTKHKFNPRIKCAHFQLRGDFASAYTTLLYQHGITVQHSSSRRNHFLRCSRVLERCRTAASLTIRASHLLNPVAFLPFALAESLARPRCSYTSIGLPLHTLGDAARSNECWVLLIILGVVTRQPAESQACRGRCEYCSSLQGH